MSTKPPPMRRLDQLTIARLEKRLADLRQDCDRLQRSWMQESARAETYRTQLKSAGVL